MYLTNYQNIVEETFDCPCQKITHKIKQLIAHFNVAKISSFSELAIKIAIPFEMHSVQSQSNKNPVAREEYNNWGKVKCQMHNSWYFPTLCHRWGPAALCSLSVRPPHAQTRTLNSVLPTLRRQFYMWCIPAHSGKQHKIISPDILRSHINYQAPLQKQANSTLTYKSNNVRAGRASGISLNLHICNKTHISIEYGIQKWKWWLPEITTKTNGNYWTTLIMKHWCC